MRLLKVWIATEYDDSAAQSSKSEALLSEDFTDPAPHAKLLFVEWSKNGDGCWVTWLVTGDIDRLAVEVA